jgi:aquaporin Z
VFVPLALVFAVLASGRNQWAAVLGGLLLTASVVALAGLSGAGFNPVRGLAPDVLAGTYPALWIYFIGPVVVVQARQPQLWRGASNQSPAS